MGCRLFLLYEGRLDPERGERGHRGASGTAVLVLWAGGVPAVVAAAAVDGFSAWEFWFRRFGDGREEGWFFGVEVLFAGHFRRIGRMLL